MYKTYKEGDKLIIGEGHVVIVTAWTPINHVAKDLKIEDYAAIGNLYFPNRGLDILVRHLLLNNHVDRLILLKDWSPLSIKAEACKSVYNFFTLGVEEAYRGSTKVWKVIDTTNAYIEYDIPLDVLTTIREEVKLHIVEKTVDPKYRIDRITNLKGYTSTRPSLEYPPIETEIKDPYSTPYSGQTIRGSDIFEIWLEALYRVKQGGYLSSNTIELKNITLVLENDDKTTSDYLNNLPDYLEVSKEYLEEYCKDLMSNISDDDCHYTYGQRINWVSYVDDYNEVDSLSPFLEAIEKLKHNSPSRQAVISLWLADDILSKNPPCLNHIHLRVNEQTNRLDMSVLFRSNDCYSAFISNCMGLRYLQEDAASRLNIQSGDLSYHVNFLHIYEQCFERVDQLINYYIQRSYTFKDDGCGSFIISTDEEDASINIDYIDINGTKLWSDSGWNIDHLMKKINREFPWLSNSHCFYLGKELTRAKHCIESGLLQYIQD